MQEQTATEKAYCCGNSAQREAKLIAKFDLVAACTGFILSIVFFSVLLSDPQAFGEVDNSTSSENATITSSILKMSSGAQITIMSFRVIWNLFEISLALLLLFGAMKRHHKSLLIWFGATIGACCVKFTSLIIGILSVNEKVILSISLVTSFLYNWYCLWIVKILLREITSVGGGESTREGYANPIDDGIEIETTEGEIPMNKF